MTQIKTTTIDQLPESTDIENLSMFGYDARKPAGSRSVRVPFGAIYPKFGISQQVGTATDKAPSEAAVAAAIEQATPLASDNQNGLLSKEQNKFINDLIKEYPMIEEVLKPDHEKYATTVAVGYPEKPTETLRELAQLVKTGATAKVLVETEVKRILDITSFYTMLTPSFIDKKVVLRTNGIATISLLEMGAITGKPNSLLVQSNEAAFKTFSAIGSSASGYIHVDISCPYLESLTLSKIGVTSLQLGHSTKLKKLHVTNSTGLVNILMIGFQATVEDVNLSGCTKLVSMGNMISNDPYANLKTYNIRKTAYTASNLVYLGNIWASRVGKEQGVLTLDQTLYDQLTDEQKAVFTAKNIAFNPVA